MTILQAFILGFVCGVAALAALLAPRLVIRDVDAKLLFRRRK